MISIIVAFREDPPGRRSILWDFVRARLKRELPEAEIVVGTDDAEDPFHKTLALNRAAAQASGDVFYLSDSDTWAPPAAVRHAADAIAADPSHWWRPWTRKLKLNEAATEHVVSLGAQWDGTLDYKAWGHPEGRNTYPTSPPLLVHRDVWNAVGGHDERIRGWGSEDDCFALSLGALYGPKLFVKGDCYHLFHPRIGRTGRDVWPGQTDYRQNQPFLVEYGRAFQAGTMRQLLADRDQALAPSA